MATPRRRTTCVSLKEFHYAVCMLGIFCVLEDLKDLKHLHRGLHSFDADRIISENCISSLLLFLLSALVTEQLSCTLLSDKVTHGV